MKEDILITYVHYQQWNFQNFKWFHWRGIAWKFRVGVLTDGGACLTGRKSGLDTKIRDNG
jgi:hypothetical protein